ncbi:hypothetical protein MWH06_07140 [Wolbachia pipientis]|nr:hypothetical protein MWH06_07140 [Wolbachia pipientis]
MKTIKKTIQGVVIAVSVLVASQSAFAGASDTLSRLCSNAAPGQLVEDMKIRGYTESWTAGDPRAYIHNKDGGVYQIQYRGTDSTHPEQQHQVVRIQQLAKLAYLTGQTINMCVDQSASPHEVWIMEVSRS